VLTRDPVADRIGAVVVAACTEELLLGMSGEWQIDLRVRREGLDDVSARFLVSVDPVQARPSPSGATAPPTADAAPASRPAPELPSAGATD
jgi:hypothetical protein